MLTYLVSRLMDKTLLTASALSALIPWAIYRINLLLHKHGDPPWKKNDYPE